VENSLSLPQEKSRAEGELPRLPAARTWSLPSGAGFRLCLGGTLGYLTLVVLLPLSALFSRSAGLGVRRWWDLIRDPRVLDSLAVTFGCAAAAATVDLTLGLLASWVLVRYAFPGRRLLDALIDLPFALPTAVAGITLATLCVPNGWIGRWLAPLGIPIAFSPLGITLAMAFVGLPLAVRSVQPVLQEMDPDEEEAAACLGAGRWTTFRRIVLPQLSPALFTAFSLSFARVIGEYGSVVFIAGNMPYKTEILPLLVITKLEQYDYAGATALGALSLVAAFVLLFSINLLKRRFSGERT
jgi:sulfate transport system permease protein